MFNHFIFHLFNFLIALISDWSSHSQLRKKNSCSLKLQGELLDHKPRKIPVEDSWIIALQNHPKCLLLNDKQMRHEILFSLLVEIQNIKKMNTRELKKSKLEKKIKRNRVNCFNIYIVVSAILEHFLFAMPDCYDFYQMIWSFQ